MGVILYHPVAAVTRLPPQKKQYGLFCGPQDVEMQDRLKTLEESHQRAMDELQNSHRLKDSTSGLWFRINLEWPYPPPSKKMNNMKKPQD